jgi:hypothetical protein
MLFPLKRASAYPHQDAPLLAGVAYNPMTQMSEIGGVPFLDAGAEALAATAHTTTAINSEDID